MSVDGVRFLGRYDPNSSDVLNLNGYKLTVGSEGIRGVTELGHIQGRGTLTSSVDFINIYNLYDNGYVMRISSVISDNSGRKVGLNVNGEAGGILEGSESNQFTGDANVNKGYLSLRKSGGAIAIRGNINIKEEGILKIFGSNQISDTSTITLKSSNSSKSAHLLLYSGEGIITEKIGRLVVEGSGVIGFESNTSSYHADCYFYLNDLVINPDSILMIEGWKEGRDHLLVKRDSAHLEDALTKMEFKGYDRNSLHLEDYNSDYWEISGAPEPAVYGAALGAIGLTLWFWRRRNVRLIHCGYR